MRPVLVIFLGTLLMMVACRDPYVQVSIASTAAVTQDWKEILPAEPLRWTKPHEEFSFHIDTPHRRGAKAEIVGPQGERCVPEVEFITADGKSLLADAHGFWGEDMYFYSSKGGPGTESIRAIRIRSSLPLQLSELIWRGYDPAEVKR